MQIFQIEIPSSAELEVETTGEATREGVAGD